MVASPRPMPAESRSGQPAVETAEAARMDLSTIAAITSSGSAAPIEYTTFRSASMPMEMKKSAVKTSRKGAASALSW